MRRSIIALMTALSCLGQAAETSKVVIGKLGQTVEKAAIYSNANTNSRIYYRAKPYEYLIIRSSKFAEWLQVVLQNRSVGYIRSDSVARLPYDVTIDKTQSAPQSSRASSGARTSIAGYALNFIGTPYKWGGNDIHSGIDCSGFVKALYGQIGLSLPRTAAEQALVGTPINRLEDLASGDRLYFWEKKRNKIGHTGIYLGNGYFVHSSSSRKGVATDDLRNPKWRNILVAARR